MFCVASAKAVYIDYFEIKTNDWKLYKRGFNYISFFLVPNMYNLTLFRLFGERQVVGGCQILSLINFPWE